MNYIYTLKKYKVIRNILLLVGNLYFYLIEYPFYKVVLPWFVKVDEQKIMFLSMPSFSDNSKALYDYVRNTHPNMKSVWLIDGRDTIPNISDKNTIFLRKSLFYRRVIPIATLKEMASSKYIFYTHESPTTDFGKRKNQIIVNLWHGCGYKDKEKSSASKTHLFDIALVPGNIFIDAKSKFWGCEKEKILPIGYPRYDMLRSKDINAKLFMDEIRSTSKKLIIWMPTFRKSDKKLYPESQIEGHFELPIVSSVQQLEELNEFCTQLKITLCVKRHPSQIAYECEKFSFSNIKFISNQDIVDKDIDFYAILQYTDGLISDYSSIAIDYILLNKPMAFSLDDYEDYKNARGFVFENPLAYMPGHHLYTFDDMLRYLQDIVNGSDSYQEARNMIMSDVHNPCENYCERVWEQINRLL